MNNGTKLGFKKSYTYVFSFFYLVQGLNDGIQGLIIPVYLLSRVDNIDLAFILLVLSITALPWTIKVFVGVFNDKYGSEKYGRRRPWIIILGAWGGLWWILYGLIIPGLDIGVIILFTMIAAFNFNLGLAISDTSIDGLILDTTPSNKLGKVQASTWSFYLVGSMCGGIILGLLFSLFNAIPYLFILEGILMISCTAVSCIIQEGPPPKDIKIWLGFKRIISKRDNWKIYISTFCESIPKNVVPLLFGLLVLSTLPNSPIKTEAVSISLASSSLEVILLFGVISIISGLGVIPGCSVAGKLSDKNRRFSVYVGHVVLIPSLFLLVLAGLNLIIAIILMVALGFGQGAVRTAYQAIRSDLAQKYPELNATYFAIIISFLNIGITAGYLIASLLLSFISSVLLITDFVTIFFIIMIVMVCIQTFSLLVFMTINREDYELKKPELTIESQPREVKANQTI